ETEALAALHRLRHAIDVHELFDQLLATIVVATATTATATIVTPTATAAVVTATTAAAAATTTAAARFAGATGLDRIAGGLALGVGRNRSVGASGRSRGFLVVRLVSHHQNSRPPSRAASASALTRPWNKYPPRSNTTVVTPAWRAASAISLPTWTAASTLAPAFSAPSVEAAATVRPCA